MRHNRLTVADLRALKGKRQLTMLFVETTDEAAAASAAGIDILSIVEPLWTPRMREAAGDCFVQVGLIYGQHCTYEDYLRAAHAGLIDGWRRVLLRGQPRHDREIIGRGHPGHRPCRPCPRARDMDRRLSGRRQDGGERATGLQSCQATWSGRRRRRRDRGRSRARGGGNLEADLARPVFDGGRRRGGRAISVRRGRPRLYSRPSTAPRKSLSQFPRGI